MTKQRKANMVAEAARCAHSWNDWSEYIQLQKFDSHCDSAYPETTWKQRLAAFSAATGVEWSAV